MNLKVMKVFHFTKKENAGCLFGWHMDEFESKFFKAHDFFSLMNVDLKWQCCPSPFVTFPKSPLLKKEPQLWRISYWKKKPNGKGGGVLRNKAANWRMDDGNLGTELWETKLGRFTSLGFDLFVGIYTATHMLKNLNWFSTFPVKIDFGTLKSILPV